MWLLQTVRSVIGWLFLLECCSSRQPLTIIFKKGLRFLPRVWGSLARRKGFGYFWDNASWWRNPLQCTLFSAFSYQKLVSSPVSSGCRIHRLHFCRRGGKTPPISFLDMTSDCKVPALGIWGIWSTLSLPLLPGPLWPGVVASDRVLSMGQIEQTMCSNEWLMLNWDHYIAILRTI